jgi:hypothetical protein
MNSLSPLNIQINLISSQKNNPLNHKQIVYPQNILILYRGFGKIFCHDITIFHFLSLNLLFIDSNCDLILEYPLLLENVFR